MSDQQPESVMALYRARLASGELRADPAQNLVIEKLSLLANRLAREGEKSSGFASAIFGWGRENVRREPLKGLYIYGHVGTGKSMVMDLFVEAVGTRAWRVHFHEFMQLVQKELARIRKGKAKDPLEKIIAQMAQKTQVLCLDEMQIENIADAMIVGRLFEGLFEAGVVLVTTSNRHPSALYKGGLNRHRFTPFIDEIEANCEVVCLDRGVDYRQGRAGGEVRYFVNAPEALAGIWHGLEGEERPFDLAIGGRVWALARTKPDAVWLTFSEACEAARGAADYQALAERFSDVLISDMPVLEKQNTSAAARFVTMIDIFYEMKTVIYIESAASLDTLHKDDKTKFVFDRTLSRLHEMGSQDWPPSD